LETEGHVEVFGDGVFGPPFSAVVVLANIFDGLDGVPAENGIVSDERCSVTTSNGVTNLSIDEVGKPGNSLFEERVGDVHDTLVGTLV
jgi:hypothetical protein